MHPLSSRKTSILLLIWLVSAMVLPSFVKASGDSWLEGWDYRRELTISNSTGAGTNYAVQIDLCYDRFFEMTHSDNFIDTAHQGVCTDGDYVYTTSSNDISKHYKDGTLVSTRDTSNDGTYGDYLGDLTYYQGYLYCASHDDVFTDHMVMKYNPNDLSFVEEYDVEEPTVPDWYGGLSIDYNNGSFWIMSDSNTDGADFEIQQYDVNFTQINTWIVDSFYISPHWHYQGLAWLDDTYIFCPIHEGSSQYIDVYVWNGDGFNQYQRIQQPSWAGGGNTNTATQGIDIEEDEGGGIDYVWLASRNGVDTNTEVGKYSLSDINEGVSLNGNCELDFADIRFTDDDGETILDHWFEDMQYISNTSAWVEVKDSLETDVSIFIYYGNSEVSSSSDGEDTFLLFEDWSSESIGAKWSIKAVDGSVSWADTDAQHGSVIKVQGDPGANRYYFISVDTYNEPVALRMRSLAESTVTDYQITQIGFEAWGNSGKQQLKSHHGDDLFTVVDSDGNDDSTNIGSSYFDSYQVYDIQLNSTHSKLYSDGILVAEGDNSPNADEWNVIVYCRDSEYDLYNDWIFVRKWLDVEPSVSEIGSEFWYYGPIGYEGLWIITTILTFTGLAMIPASVVYLVYGGKESMSSDKMLYFLILFFMGWGLFIGGITP